MTTSTIAALPITTPSMVREAFSLSPASAQKAKRTLSSQRIIRAAVVSGKSHSWSANSCRHSRLPRAGWIARRAAPDAASPSRKREGSSGLAPVHIDTNSRIVNEYAGRPRRVRAILEVIVAAVEQQCRATGIKENGRKSVVRIGFDQLSGRTVLQSFEPEGRSPRYESNRTSAIRAA